MIRRLAFEIVEHGRGNLSFVVATASEIPRKPAKETLVRQRGETGPTRIGGVEIGKMSQSDQGFDFDSIPVGTRASRAHLKTECAPSRIALRPRASGCWAGYLSINPCDSLKQLRAAAVPTNCDAKFISPLTEDA